MLIHVKYAATISYLYALRNGIANIVFCLLGVLPGGIE